MKSGILLSVMAFFLLAGCSVWRPAGGEAVCDCRREVKVPDRAFRSWLVDNGYAVKVGGKRLRATPKGCEMTVLECFDKGIHSLEGVALFPQLQEIVCSDNPVEVLDLNCLRGLRAVYGVNMPLRRLAIDSCHEMRHIELSHTRLDTFTLAPFPHLDFFFCIFSPLTTLDLAPCPALETIYIRGTRIEELDVRPCRELWQIHALDTPLQRLIVSPEQYRGEIKVSVPDSVNIIVR